MGEIIYDKNYQYCKGDRTDKKYGENLSTGFSIETRWATRIVREIFEEAHSEKLTENFSIVKDGDWHQLGKVAYRATKDQKERETVPDLFVYCGDRLASIEIQHQVRPYLYKPDQPLLHKLGGVGHIKRNKVDDILAEGRNPSRYKGLVLHEVGIDGVDIAYLLPITFIDSRFKDGAIKAGFCCPLDNKPGYICPVSSVFVNQARYSVMMPKLIEWITS